MNKKLVEYWDYFDISLYKEYINIKNQHNTEVDEEVNIDDLKVLLEQKQLIIFNDDVNTFDYVIYCLIKYCDHDMIQAEQCTTLIHHTGKCSVKTGTMDELRPIKEVLDTRGLTVEIQ